MLSEKSRSEKFKALVKGLVRKDGSDGLWFRVFVKSRPSKIQKT